MPTLKLERLRCANQHHDLSEDRVVLTLAVDSDIRHRRWWSGRFPDDDHEEDLSALERVRFRGFVSVKLWETQSSPDLLLGEATISAGILGRECVEFRQESLLNDTVYQLFVRVVH